MAVLNAEQIARLTTGGIDEDFIERLNSILGEESPKIEEPIENKATKILQNFGVPSHIKGFQYLREAIVIGISTEKEMKVTKELYPEVAKKFATTSSRVERAMRHAISVAAQRSVSGYFQRYFGYTINPTRGVPTNSEFIFRIIDDLKLGLL